MHADVCHRAVCARHRQPLGRSVLSIPDQLGVRAIGDQRAARDWPWSHSLLKAAKVTPLRSRRRLQVYLWGPSLPLARDRILTVTQTIILFFHWAGALVRKGNLARETHMRGKIIFRDYPLGERCCGTALAVSCLSSPAHSFVLHRHSLGPYTKPHSSRKQGWEARLVGYLGKIRRRHILRGPSRVRGLSCFFLFFTRASILHEGPIIMV